MSETQMGFYWICDYVCDSYLMVMECKGYCVIIVTHDPEVAAACDVQYRMQGGTLI